MNCLLWEYDGERYSASGLVMSIWGLAAYQNAPVSVQGPSRWVLEDGRSLWQLSVQVLAEQDDEG